MESLANIVTVGVCDQGANATIIDAEGRHGIDTADDCQSVPLKHIDQLDL